MVDPNLRRKYAGRYQEYEELPFAEPVTSVLRTYVRTAIPAYRHCEASFWGVSCLATNTIARVNIFWQEVMNVHELEDGLWVSIYMADSPFDGLSEEAKDQYFERFQTLWGTEHRYRPGGADQVNLRVALEEAEAFLADPVVLQAIRLFNLRLMKKGPCVYGRYHCMDLADRLVE
jgi:hypothetical protein